MGEHKGPFAPTHKEIPMNDTTTTPIDLAGIAPATDDEAAAMPLDKRLVGERSRANLLHWIYRFGWLTSRMAAGLCWPSAAQGWQMARRTLNSMLEEGLIIKRALPGAGTDAFLLSAKGARLLRDTTGADAASGQNMTLGNALHRACSNWALIDAVNEGCDVVTEHEIAADRAAVRVLDGKVPDGIILYEGGDATFLEVENSWKAVKARDAITAFCARHLDQPTMTQIAPEHWLRKVGIVSTNMDALRHMSGSFLKAYRAGELTEGQLQMVEVTLLPVSPSLVPGERVQGSLWMDVLMPHLQ